jgi:hypothetical protein
MTRPPTGGALDPTEQDHEFAAIILAGLPVDLPGKKYDEAEKWVARMVRECRALATEQQRAGSGGSAGVFLVGDHKTCPACESLILPDGTCVTCRRATPEPLRPAADVAHEWFGHECGLMNGKVRHSPSCSRAGDAIEADRLTRSRQREKS